jgi:hypothetical protein
MTSYTKIINCDLQQIVTMQLSVVNVYLEYGISILRAGDYYTPGISMK